MPQFEVAYTLEKNPQTGELPTKTIQATTHRIAEAQAKIILERKHGEKVVIKSTYLKCRTTKTCMDCQKRETCQMVGTVEEVQRELQDAGII